MLVVVEVVLTRGDAPVMREGEDIETEVVTVSGL